MIAFNERKIFLTSILIFDGNMVSHWRTFIYLKGVGRLGSKTSNVAKPTKTEFFLEVRPNKGRSFPLGMSRESGHLF